MKLAGNPGVELFHEGLRSYGIIQTHELKYDVAWLKEHADEINFIHVQWPEKIWNGRVGGRLDRTRKLLTAGRLRGVLNVRRCLDVANKLGLKRIWTVHNVEPHEGGDWIDRLGYRIVANRADLLICYSHAAVNEIESKYSPHSPILPIHHGNYTGVYPTPNPRDVVLRELGLDASLPVVNYSGIIRPYKGVDVAFDAAKRLEGRVQFVISGKLHESVDGARLKRKAAALSNVVYEPRLLEDQEYADRHGACDVVLLPFHRITGSGSLLAALTFGRGIVASNLPLFREMLAPNPDAGELFPVGDAAGCASAITRYLEEVAFDQREKAARSIADNHSWERCVKPVADLLLSQ